KAAQRAKQWDWLAWGLMAAAYLITGFVLGGNPIPYGDRESGDRALTFVKREFKDRQLGPYPGGSQAVAAVFALIRSGDDGSAKKAIDFAAENHLGFASPYVIERLESDDDALRLSAHNYLIRIARQDLGWSAQSWRSWWSNPTRWVLGIVPIGQHT